MTIDDQNTADELEAQKIWDNLDKKEAGEATDEQAPPNPEVKTDGDLADNHSERAEEANSDTQQTPAGSETPADIWANATEEQRSALEAIRKENETTKSEWKRMSGTVSSYQRQIDDLKRQLQAPSKTDAEKKDDEAKADESILDDPEFTQAAEDYPEVFGPVKKVISVLENRTKTAIERAERAERELSGISQERRDANLEVQAQIVAEAHPDYSSIAGSKEFAEWYKNQPRLVQEGVQRNAKSIVDGNEVAYIVKLYKDSAGISTTTKQPASGKPSNSGDPRRKHQLESASTPSNRGPAKVQGGVPDDENAAWEYFERMDEQKKQRAEQR